MVLIISLIEEYIFAITSLTLGRKFF